MDAEGRGFVSFNLSDFIDVSVETVSHFKVFCISNMWTSALAEGTIAIYQGNMDVKLDWKNDLINTISISNNQLSVVGNSNFYGCYCTIYSIYNWTQTP